MVYIEHCAQTGLEGISKLHKEVPQIPWCLTLTHCLFSHILCYGLMGSSLQSADTGRENSGLVYRWFCMICRNRLKLTAAVLELLSGKSLKDSGERKLS